MSPADTDILIVGAGPVGLAAAVHARRAGYTVTVMDQRTGPIDKACGEGLLPGALAAVLALGVDPPGHRIAGITYAAQDRQVDHRFPGPGGRGVRRTALTAALADLARAEGAVIRRGRVTGVVHERGMVSAAGVRAAWLLGCDGLHSTVRRATGLELTAPPHHHLRPQARPGRVPGAKGTTPQRVADQRRYGLRTHYALAPWTDLVEVHWGPAAEAYVTPVGPAMVGLAVLGPRGTSIDETLTTLPKLAARLRGARQITPIRGAGPLRQTTRARTMGRVRLVGDAAGYLDALTGEGLAIGFAQAAAVIDHVDDAAAYERDWRRLTRTYRHITGALLTIAASAARPMIVPAASALPAVYGRIVERIGG